MKVHCEADNVHSALHVHSTYSYVREKTQPHRCGSSAGLVPIPTYSRIFRPQYSYNTVKIIPIPAAIPR